MCCKMRSKRRKVPPYTFSPHTTWSPDLKSFMIESMHPVPLAKAKPWRPPSSAATLRSSASRVGFLPRAYSYPLCSPSASCTYVDVRYTGVMIAPASGSGRWPAWIARVAKAVSRSSSKMRVILTLGGREWGKDNRRGARRGTRARASGADEWGLVDGGSRGAGAPPHCLVVDDEPRLRQVLVRLMESDGFVCRQAASGVEALAQLCDAPATLVLTDLRMPRMDGAELLREVRARYPDTAVVMITASADVDAAVRCLTLGA